MDAKTWKHNCAYCGANEETRPYGPRGERICFDCAMKPDNKSTTEAMYLATLDAAGPAVVLGEDGPRPATEFVEHKGH